MASLRPSFASVRQEMGREGRREGGRVIRRGRERMLGCLAVFLAEGKGKRSVRKRMHACCPAAFKHRREEERKWRGEEGREEGREGGRDALSTERAVLR